MDKATIDNLKADLKTNEQTVNDKARKALLAALSGRSAHQPQTA